MPWFLLAGGIVLVVLGALLGGLPGRPNRGRRGINRRMRDADIARELSRADRPSGADLVLLAGLACIAISVGWRLIRAII